MAYFHGTIYSQVLQMNTSVTAVVPNTILTDEKPYPVVYLLHGLSGNFSDWESAQLQLLSETYRICLILPEVQRSFYIDMKYGLPYFTYISEELPKICKKLFPISDKREDTYVMGLSMGGYGALKCALKKPEQYAGCAAFSAACDIEEVAKRAEEEQRIDEMKAILGLDYELLKENDLFLIAKECEASTLKPSIFMTCGTEDFIYNMSVKFRDFMKDVDIPFVYQEWSGTHEWYLWNKSLHLACEHFFERVQLENYCNIQ